MIGLDEPPARRCKRGHRDWQAHVHGWRCKTCKRILEKRRRRRAARVRQHEEKRIMQRRDFPDGYLHHPARRIPLKPGYVHNDVVREFVLAAMRREPDLTFSDLAERCDWHYQDGRPDSIRVTRGLGITPFRDNKLRAKIAYRQLISEEDAVALGRSVHVDPWELGL